MHELWFGSTSRKTATPTDIENAYKTLGLPTTSDPNTVGTTFRKLARQFHPDQNSIPNATQKFQDIGAAYTILKEAGMAK